MQYLRQAYGNARFVKNHFLHQHLTTLSANDQKGFFQYNDASAQLPALKKEFPFLKLTCSVSLQQGLKQLHQAWLNFYQRPDHFAPPVYKKKRDTQSITLCKAQFTVLLNKKGEPYALTISKVKSPIPLCWPKKANLKVRELVRASSITISTQPSGRTQVSFKLTKSVKTLPKTGCSIGLDLGLKALFVTSAGESIAAPRFLRKALTEKKRLSRMLSQMKTRNPSNKDGKTQSNRYQQLKLRLAKLEARVARLRKELNHQLSFMLVKHYDVISVETLKIKNMVKNHCLAMSLHDVAWGQLLQFLEYKSDWYGKSLFRIDQWRPSTKTCNHCGTVIEGITLKDRQIQCPSCGTQLHRDYNASCNIEKWGLALGKESGLDISTLQRGVPHLQKNTSCAHVRVSAVQTIS